jgi:hypothetical protein
MTHQQVKDKIAHALKLKWFRGRDQDWGFAWILNLKGTEFVGTFLCDLNSLDGPHILVLMVRKIVDGQEVDEELDFFDTQKDNVEQFIKKLKWL